MVVTLLKTMLTCEIRALRLATIQGCSVLEYQDLSTGCRGYVSSFIQEVEGVYQPLRIDQVIGRTLVVEHEGRYSDGALINPVVTAIYD